MTFSYENINEILASNGPIRGARYSVNKERRIIVPTINYFDDPINSIQKDKIEIHVFNKNTSYIGSIYDIKSWTVDNIQDPSTIYFDILSDVAPFKLPMGSYRLVYNFSRPIISSRSALTKLFVAEISRNRQEIVLALTDPNDEIEQNNLTSFVLNYLQPKKYLPTTILNFGKNRILDIINVTSDGSLNYFYVKLMKPLPSYLDLRAECWLETQILKPYIDSFEIQDSSLKTKKNVNQLRGPNYSVASSYNIASDTELKSWNDLLSENAVSSQEILNKYINGNNPSIKLNIDFTKFENFVFYSSAQERVENFYYKMQLLETYSSQLDNLSSIAASTVDMDNNIILITNLRDKIVSGFDDWEKWLYYEEYIANSGVINPFPKYEAFGIGDIRTKTGDYRFYRFNSTSVQDWYKNTLDLAETFDRNNVNSLKAVLPEFITSDSQNEQFMSFVNMIGQHFDIVYLYINHILKKNTRDQDPSKQLSQDLVEAVTNTFGWKLSSNIQDKELWEFALGVGEDFEQKTNVLGQKYNRTEEERTKEVWRRILNNLPYIQKTKGTTRGIKALLAAYGIPQTLLYIREHGGYYNPNSDTVRKNTYDKATYYLNFSGSSQQYINIPWEKVYYQDEWVYPDTVTFRWRMNPEKIYNYAGIENEVVLQKNFGSRVDWFVTINKNGTDIEKGTLTFWLGDGTNYLTASFYDEYLYDDVPLNIMIRRKYTDDLWAENQIYDFILKTEKYGKLSIEKSASIYVSGSSNPNYNRAWSSNGNLVIGKGSNIETDKKLFGAVFELRYWSNQLNQTAFDNHVLAARAYNGNTSTSSFYDLQAQFKFWQPIDLAVTSNIESSHPNQKEKTFQSSSKEAYLVGFTSRSYEAITEVYNMEVAGLGANLDYVDKIRIDSSSLNSALNMHTSYEKSILTAGSPDSNRLTVAFSPQNIINEDIFESIGNTDLSEYIGDYSTIDDEEYFLLNEFSNEYWKKYENRNDFNAYINLIAKFDLSVFEQIAQTLPARTNELLGLVLEPNVLERTKTLPVKKISGETDNFVKKTTPITKDADVIASHDTKNTVLFIGFEEGDLLDVNMIESENDVISEVYSDTDENIGEGEIETNGKVPTEINTKRALLKLSNKKNLDLRYVSYNTLLKTDITNKKITFKSTTYVTPLSIDKKVLGETYNIRPASINTNFIQNYNSASIYGAYMNQVDNYESEVYYNYIIKYSNSSNVNDIEYSVTTSSVFASPSTFNSAKQNREFMGCNDYPLPYKKKPIIGNSFYNSNSNMLDYSKILENYEDSKYEHNDSVSTMYAYSGSTNFGVFPSSSYWKTYIRGGFLTGSGPNKINDMYRNVYGMIDTAPRIIKLKTSETYMANRKLFSPRYLQEGRATGTNTYLNYPVSSEYIRSFPWVLWWSGSNSNVPNLGPDNGFTKSITTDIAISSTDPRNPKYQK